MTIVLPALAVAFGALCVWLTVRIVNRRERWAKWTLAAAIVVGSIFALIIREEIARQAARRDLKALQDAMSLVGENVEGELAEGENTD
jgi:hypothetical protein